MFTKKCFLTDKDIDFLAYLRGTLEAYKEIHGLDTDEYVIKLQELNQRIIYSETVECD